MWQNLKNICRKTSLEEIACSVEKIVLPVDSNFEKDQTTDAEDCEQLQLVAAVWVQIFNYFDLPLNRSITSCASRGTSDVQSLEIPATDATWKIETMILPDLSRTMAYTTRNTVNRLVRKEFHLNPVVPERSME